MNAIRSLKINRRNVSNGSLQDESGDKAFWLSQTYHQRLKALEILRQINYSHHKSSARLQRIPEITERTPDKYLLIGGYAVAYCGTPRAAADMDVWVEAEPANADKIVAALNEFGFDLPVREPPESRTWRSTSEVICVTASFFRPFSWE